MQTTRRLVPVAALFLLAAAPWQVVRASPELAARAGCLACHMVDRKLIGPSWRDIAAKYKGKADAPALLAARVRKGGKDVWGPVAMAPADPKRVSDADIKALVAWILKMPA